MQINQVLVTDAPLNQELHAYSKNLAEIHDPTNHREKFKQFLEKFRHHAEFYTEIDLKTQTISWSYGLKEWMGHPKPADNDDQIDSLDKYIHPFALEWYRYYVKAMTAAFTEKTFTKTLDNRFVITVPMRNVQGQYLLIKMVSMPFGLTAKGRLATLINSWSLFGPYRGEGLSIEIFDGNKKMDEKKDDTLKTFRKKLAPCVSLDRKIRLSKGDIKYAGFVAHLSSINKKTGLDTILAYQKKLEKNEDIKEATVLRAIVRLHERTKVVLGYRELATQADGLRDPYLPDFDDPYHLIQYCIDSGIIDLLKSYRHR
jgi:hypothetical protein